MNSQYALNQEWLDRRRHDIEQAYQVIANHELHNYPYRAETLSEARALIAEWNEVVNTTHPHLRYAG